MAPYWVFSLPVSCRHWPEKHGLTRGQGPVWSWPLLSRAHPTVAVGRAMLVPAMLESACSLQRAAHRSCPSPLSHREHNCAFVRLASPGALLGAPPTNLSATPASDTPTLRDSIHCPLNKLLYFVGLLLSPATHDSVCCFLSSSKVWSSPAETMSLF